MAAGYESLDSGSSRFSLTVPVEENGAQCWMSGHMHDAYRAVVGDTLVIGNPAGYPNEVVESPLFRTDRVIEVSPMS